MKKEIIIAAMMLLGISASGQEKIETKKGWSLSALPCVSYSQDLGFQYGAFGHLYNYGDGTIYPQFKHDLGWEFSHFTKGRTRAYLSIDSKHIIPGLRVMGSVTYVDDPLYNFYGFNGGAQDYDASNHSYNFMKRNMFRALMDVQGDIRPGLNWAAGLAFWDFMTGDPSDKYGYDPQNTLYHHYVSNGVIRNSEALGGLRLEAKAGITYNTRDVEAAPSKGIFAEAYVNASPDFFGDGNPFYMKANLHFSQFISLPFQWNGGGTVFAYHLGYQGTIAGETPWYMQANTNFLILRSMISEGFGGINTIRGTYTSRMIGEGYAWANTDLRIKLFSFSFLKQYFYVAVNPFFDFGKIVQPYRVDEMAYLPELAIKYGSLDHAQIVSAIKSDATEMQYSYGIGLKIGWNQNFIVTADIGQTARDGIGYRKMDWINIGAGYNF